MTLNKYKQNKYTCTEFTSVKCPTNKISSVNFFNNYEKHLSQTNKLFRTILNLLQLQVASKEHLSKLCNKLGFESLRFGSWFKKTTYVPFIKLTKLVTYLMLILNPITYQHT